MCDCLQPCHWSFDRGAFSEKNARVAGGLQLCTAVAVSQDATVHGGARTIVPLTGALPVTSAVIDLSGSQPLLVEPDAGVVGVLLFVDAWCGVFILHT